MQRLSAGEGSTGIQREEILAAVAETLGLFLIFVVAITTRDLTGDWAKAILKALTWIVGLVGAGYGAMTIWRGISHPNGRIARVAVGGAMAFMGIYSIVHVMS